MIGRGPKTAGRPAQTALRAYIRGIASRHLRSADRIAGQVAKLGQTQLGELLQDAAGNLWLDTRLLGKGGGTAVRGAP